MLYVCMVKNRHAQSSIGMWMLFNVTNCHQSVTRSVTIFAENILKG
jgi:hypothetical protein